MSHLTWDEGLKKIRICYVCGLRIPLFGGTIVHVGKCAQIYKRAVYEFNHARYALAKKPTA